MKRREGIRWEEKRSEVKRGSEKKGREGREGKARRDYKSLDRRRDMGR